MQDQNDRAKSILEKDVKKMAQEFLKEQYLEMFLYLYIYFLICCGLTQILTSIQIAMCLIFFDICRIIQTCYSSQKELRVYYYLESFIYCLMKICYILIIFLEVEFFLMLILFPLLLLIIRLLVYCNKKKYYVFIAFQQFFNVLWKIVILVETLSVSLKLDGFVTWDWLQVFWLFLIILILDAVIIFISTLYFVGKILPIQLKKYDKVKSAYYLQYFLYQGTILLTNIFLYINYFVLGIILPISFIVITFYTYYKKCDLEQYYTNFILNLEVGKDLEDKNQTYEQATILQRVSTNYYKPIMTTIGQRQQSIPQIMSNDIQSVNSEEHNLCVICQDKVGEKIFMPCGHGKFCVNCIGNTETCYLCRNGITQILTVQPEHISFGIIAK